MLQGKPNPSFTSHPSEVLHWVSDARAAQEGYRQCEPQNRFREGATANLKIILHVPLTQTSRPSSMTFLLDIPARGQRHQPSLHKTPSLQDEMTQ